MRKKLQLLIRDVTDSQRESLKLLAAGQGLTLNAYLLALIDDVLGDFDPGLVLGYIELRGGELDTDETCQECNMGFEERGVFIGFTANLKPFGPVCGLCATTG